MTLDESNSLQHVLNVSMAPIVAFNFGNGRYSYQ